MFQEIIESFRQDEIEEKLTRISDQGYWAVTAKSIDELLLVADNLWHELTGERVRVGNWIERVETIDTWNQAAYRAISECEERLTFRAIFQTEIYKAVQINKEFAQPMFLDRLLGLATLQEIYRVFPDVNGSIIVLIRSSMDVIAGKLDEYAQAVSAVRKENRNNSNIPAHLKNVFASAELASHFWEEKFYGVAVEGRTIVGLDGKVDGDKTALYREKYISTMKRRLALCTHVAPFWELLDRGSIPMSSDIGGTPYPVNVATNFVYKAESEIRKFVEKSAKGYQRVYDVQKQNSVGKAKEYDRKLVDWRSRLDDIMEQLRIFRDRIIEDQNRYQRESDNMQKKIVKVETFKVITKDIRKEYIKESKPFSEVILTKIEKSVTAGVPLETKSRGRIFKGGKTYYTRQLSKDFKEAWEQLP